MGIGGIGQLYQNYNRPVIKEVSTETVRQQDELKKQQEQEMPSSIQLEANQVEETQLVRSTPKLEDISLTFHQNETYDYIGKDKDINQLDMDQAISDMRKDQVLEQYQYFVAPLNQTNFASEDGQVIMK